jgi:hypothetical protein
VRTSSWRTSCNWFLAGVADDLLDLFDESGPGFACPNGRRSRRLRHSILLQPAHFADKSLERARGERSGTEMTAMPELDHLCFPWVRSSRRWPAGWTITRGQPDVYAVPSDRDLRADWHTGPRASVYLVSYPAS